MSSSAAEIAARHEQCIHEDMSDTEPHCESCGADWPCDAAVLLARVTELTSRAELSEGMIEAWDQAALDADQARSDWGNAAIDRAERAEARVTELEGALRDILNDADARDDANIGERLRHVDTARALLADAPEPMP